MNHKNILSELANYYCHEVVCVDGCAMDTDCARCPFASDKQPNVNPNWKQDFIQWLLDNKENW